MRKPYKLLYKGGTEELVEKKSRFIATLSSVKTEEEAISFLEEVRKKYWNANHNCYAWVIGADGESKRCSDDGEPSQTAGRPMLDVLTGEKISNACVVVTRYFGGTLLGTGGLVRAYSSAVKAGLLKSVVLDVYPACKLMIDTDYNGIGRIQYLLEQKELTILDREYTDRVLLTILVPDDVLDRLQKEIAEITNGQAGVKLLAEVYYGIHEQQVQLF